MTGAEIKAWRERLGKDEKWGAAVLESLPDAPEAAHIGPGSGQGRLRLMAAESDVSSTPYHDFLRLKLIAALDAEQTPPHPREVDEARIITELASRMRAKLAIRRHHGNWRELPVGEVLYRLIAETHELNDAIDVLFNDPDRGETNRESVIGEAVDVAAYCAMLIDVLSKEGGE